MSEQRESFVFYRSFFDNLRRIPTEDRLTAYESLIACALGDKALDALPYPLDAIIGQMLTNVDAARKRYDAATENGKKGGRPRRWVDQTEAEMLYSELGSWDKVAEELDVDRKTLRHARAAWERGKTGKNPNVNVNVNDNVNVNETLSINNNNAPAARAQSASPRREPTEEERREGIRQFREMWTKSQEERRSMNGDQDDTS